MASLDTISSHSVKSGTLQKLKSGFTDKKTGMKQQKELPNVRHSEVPRKSQLSNKSSEIVRSQSEQSCESLEFSNARSGSEITSSDSVLTSSRMSRCTLTDDKRQIILSNIAKHGRKLQTLVNKINESSETVNRTPCEQMPQEFSKSHLYENQIDINSAVDCLSKDEKSVLANNKQQMTFQNESETVCAICMDTIDNPKTLSKCGHIFCTECIDNCFNLHKPVCPSCGTLYGTMIGTMPSGTMEIFESDSHIAGYKKYKSYCINYTFPAGTQGPEHPNPGIMYCRTSRTAYLPASPDGVQVCKMLKLAFQRRVTFTVGVSATTGRENSVTWNDIHHKTAMSGGPTNFGYPDPTYLCRVKEELACKGVTKDDIEDVTLQNEIIEMNVEASRKGPVPQ